MADLDDLIVSMCNTEVDPSGPTYTINGLAEQLACTTMENVEMDDDSGLSTSSSLQTIDHRDLQEAKDDLGEGEIQEEDKEDNDDLTSCGEPAVTDYDDKNSETSGPDSSQAPIEQVFIANCQHLRRITPDTQIRSTSLLQTRKGMRIISLYNTWLSCSA